MLGRTVREDNMGALEEWLTTAPPDGELSIIGRSLIKGGAPQVGFLNMVTKCRSSYQLSDLIKKHY